MLLVYHILGSLVLLGLGWLAGRWTHPYGPTGRRGPLLRRSKIERVYNDLWYNEGMVNTDITGHDSAGSGPPHADSERADSAAVEAPVLEDALSAPPAGVTQVNFDAPALTGPMAPEFAALASLPPRCGAAGWTKEKGVATQPQVVEVVRLWDLRDLLNDSDRTES